MNRLNLCRALWLALLCIFAPLNVTAQSLNQAEQLARIKSDVAAIGTGLPARAVVKQRDGRKLKGYISFAGDEFFVISDSKTNAETKLAYADVTEVKRTKSGSTRRGVLLGVGVTFVVLALIGGIANS